MHRGVLRRAAGTAAIITAVLTAGCQSVSPQAMLSRQVEARPAAAPARHEQFLKAARPGYRLLAADGGLFSFGGATFHGSAGDRRFKRPVVGLAATPTGDGYWLAKADGEVFAFGDARFQGSAADMDLDQPIVTMVARPQGDGYWLAGADGAVFDYGDAPGHGGLGRGRLNQPVVGMAVTRTGAGYWLVARDGGLFAFGDAAFHGSLWGGCGAVPAGGGHGGHADGPGLLAGGPGRRRLRLR